MPKGKSLLEKIKEEIMNYYNDCLPPEVENIITERIYPWYERYRLYLKESQISDTEKSKINRVLESAFYLSINNATRYKKRNGNMSLSENISCMDNPVSRSPEESVEELIANNKVMLKATKYDPQGINEIIAQAYVFGFLYDYNDYLVYSRFYDGKARAKMLADIQANQIKEELEIIEV